MIDFIKANKQPIATSVVLLVLFGLQYFPQLGHVRELLTALAAAWGLFGTMFVPSFAKPDGDDNG